MPTIASTSGRLLSDVVRLLFLQTHLETDRFFIASGVYLAQSNSGLFHFHRVDEEHTGTLVSLSN